MKLKQLLAALSDCDEDKEIYFEVFESESGKAKVFAIMEDETKIQVSYTNPPDSENQLDSEKPE